MARFITVSTSVSSVSVPTPPVSFDTESVSFPDVGPYEIPDIDVDPVFITFPDIDIPEITVPFPDLSVTTDTEVFDLSQSFAVPDVTLPELDPDFSEIDIPLTDFSFYILDPFGTRLSGGSVGIDILRLSFGFTVDVPDPSLSTRDRSFGGQSFDLPAVFVPGIDVDTPDIPRITFPTVTVPTSASLTGSVAVPDPTSLSVSVAIDWDSVSSFILSPIPDGFLSDPAQWVFDTALAMAERNVTTPVAETLRRVGEGFFELLLGDETKQRLQDRRRDR